VTGLKVRTYFERHKCVCKRGIFAAPCILDPRALGLNFTAHERKRSESKMASAQNAACACRWETFWRTRKSINVFTTMCHIFRTREIHAGPERTKEAPGISKSRTQTFTVSEHLSTPMRSLIFRFGTR